MRKNCSSMKMWLSLHPAVCVNLCNLTFFAHFVTSFLVFPEDLPLIFKALYGGKGHIEKGTDSRVGVGFRVGDRADFQLLFELGPQRKTQPIGNSLDVKKKRDALLAKKKKTEPEMTMYKSKRKNKSMLQRSNALNKARNMNKSSIRNIPSKGPNQFQESRLPSLKTEAKSEGSEWLARWRQGVMRTPRVSIAPVDVTVGTISQHHNRLKVVESTSNPSGANQDLIVLQRLFAKSF